MFRVKRVDRIKILIWDGEPRCAPSVRSPWRTRLRWRRLQRRRMWPQQRLKRRARNTGLPFADYWGSHLSGKASAHLAPLTDMLAADLKTSTKLFMEFEGNRGPERTHPRRSWTRDVRRLKPGTSGHCCVSR